MVSDNRDKVIKALANSETDVEKEVEKKKMDLIKALLTSEPKGDPVTEMARLTFIKDLIKDFKTKTEDNEDKILGKVITWAMLNQTLQQSQPRQNIDPALLLLLTQPKSSGNSEWIKFMQLYLQQQMQLAQQERQTQQQLLAMIFGKQKSDVEELKAKTEDMINRLNERIDMLMAQGGEKQPGIKEYLQQMIEVRNTLKEAVEKLGVVEKSPEITDKSGKVQLGKLLERGLKIAEKIIERMPTQQPVPKSVQMIPIEETKPGIKEIPEKPKIEEEIKPVEEKIEKLEKKVEELPKIEAIIPERPSETETKTEEVKEEKVEERKEVAEEQPAEVEYKEEEPNITYEYSTGEEESSETAEEQKTSK